MTLVFKLQFLLKFVLQKCCYLEPEPRTGAGSPNRSRSRLDWLHYTAWDDGINSGLAENQSGNGKEDQQARRKQSRDFLKLFMEAEDFPLAGKT